MVAALAVVSCSPTPPLAQSHGTAERISIPVAFEGNSTLTPAALYRQVNVRKSYLSANHPARRGLQTMNPRYITIHSTQNWRHGADCNRHAQALHNGALGRVCWHFTTDQNGAVQHLPTTLRGRHADGPGPGNRYSIGIEMCEHPGNSLPATIDRTARLAAWLMVEHDIPLNHVVPHYHWPRRGKNPANKNCPHFLLDHGRPGKKWAAFRRKVDRYHKLITSSSPTGQWVSR